MVICAGKCLDLIPGLPIVILSASSEVAEKVLLLERGRRLCDPTVPFAGTCCTTARRHQACIAGRCQKRASP